MHASTSANRHARPRLTLGAIQIRQHIDAESFGGGAFFRGLEVSYFSSQLAPRAAALLIGVLALGASAQTPHNHAAMTEMKPAAAPTTAVAPVSPVAPVTPSSSPLRYESVFARYQSYRDEKTGSWREANETVDRIGGWRAYAKEAQQPDSVAPIAPTRAQPQTTKPNPHAGHGGKP